MRHLIFLFLFISFSLQAQFTDDFSDGDYTNNPSWFGMNSDFIVNTNLELQLDAPAATSKSYLVTTSSMVDSVVWEFDVRMGFTPSASNRADVFLMSDTDSLLAGNINGYFVRIGNTNREISLWRTINGTNTRIITGAPNTVNNSSPHVRIKVFRDPQGNWELLRDLNAGTDYISEGTVNDNSINAASFFGVVCDYTSTRSNLFYFDNFFVGLAYPDTIPARITTLEVLSNNQVLLNYSKPILPGNAQLTQNYFVNNGIGNPLSAILSNDSMSVTLTFGSNFINLTNYTLNINSQVDKVGNLTPSQQRIFFFLIPDTPSAGDVIFSEFMANENPSQGLPASEWVEIFNKSNKVFSLKDWEFTDASSTVGVLPDSIIMPGEYIILCPISFADDFRAYGKTIGLNNWPILNNGSDDLILTAANGSIMDFISYTDGWYRDNTKRNGGWSLEIINPFHPCAKGGVNWTASLSPVGGTPGGQNSVNDTTPDISPPVVTNYQRFGATFLQINFDKSIDSASIFDKDAFFIQPGLTIFNTTPINDYTGVEIEFAPLIQGQRYQITVAELKDCLGNTIIDTILDFGLGETPQLHELIITEFMASPIEAMPLPNFQYVEIYNRSNRLLSLDSLFFADRTAKTQLNGILAAGEYAIICRSSALSEFSRFGKAIGVSSLPTLNQTGDDLKLLLGREELLIDELSYTQDWYSETAHRDGGFALEMIDVENFCAGQSNWGSSVDPLQGTPGKVNSIAGQNPDNEPPGFKFIAIENEIELLLSFTEKINIEALNINNFTITPSLEIAAVEVISQSEIKIILQRPPTLRRLYQLSGSDILDCVGNKIDPSLFIEFALPEEAVKGDIIINEILFNPRTTDGSNFVELLNLSNKYIDLSQFLISNYNLDLDTFRNVRTITERQFLIYPGEFVFIANNVDNIHEEYPKSVDKKSVQASLPSFANSGSQVVLIIKGEPEAADRFDYLEEYHFPALRNVKGVSLERIDPNRDSQDPENWLSAAESENYATPGYENSQRLRERATTTNAMELIPEIFSPDNDGFNDVVEIAFNLPSGGFVAKITIYDQRGAAIRQLVQNSFVEQEGSFIWDGVTDRNEKAAVGVYVVFGEFYAPDGNVIREKQTVVVATRF